MHLHELSDAALVAPLDAASAFSAKRQPGAPPRGFLPRPPFLLQVVGCQGEKSLLAGRSLHISQGRDLLCLLSRSLHFLGAGVAALAMRKKRGGFPTTVHAFNRCSSCHEHTLILTHTHVLPHIKAHKDTILTHFSLNSHEQEYVKHINKACTIFRPLLFSKPTC